MIFHAIMLIKNFNNFRFFNDRFSTSVHDLKIIKKNFIFNMHFF